MRKKRLIWTSLLVCASVVASSGLLAEADGLDVGQTADSIFRAAQQQQVQQQQNSNDQQYQPATNNAPVRSGDTTNNASSGGNVRSDDSNTSAGLSNNNSDSDDDSWGGSSDPGLSNNDTSSAGKSSSGIRSSDSSVPSYHASKRSLSKTTDLSPKQKAEIKADNYLAKVRQRIALKTAQNNDGGAWALRHSYENQLEVIKNGSRTAQTRALQVQLSGELDQLQVAHDQRVNTFNQKIDQLANDHDTDTQAVNLQDAIDYEDAKLAIKQADARKKIMKRIKAINPVNKKKAQSDAKRDYNQQLKEKGLTDPYKLQKQNRQLWQQAQEKADEMRSDY